MDVMKSVIARPPFCQSVDADHKNNARNEFLRSDVYEKMVLRMNLALLLKKL